MTRTKNNLHIVCIVFTLAHFFYTFSFISCFRKLWHGCAIAITIYVFGFLYFCFADVFRSIPMMVIPLTFHVCTVAVSVVIAGSIWMYGSRRVDAQQVFHI